MDARLQCCHKSHLQTSPKAEEKRSSCSCTHSSCKLPSTPLHIAASCCTCCSNPAAAAVNPSGTCGLPGDRSRAGDLLPGLPALLLLVCCRSAFALAAVAASDADPCLLLHGRCAARSPAPVSCSCLAALARHCCSSCCCACGCCSCCLSCCSSSASHCHSCCVSSLRGGCALGCCCLNHC
mgnify:CR=1 FL=1